MKKTKTSLLHSGLALLLCISMLIGSTFAWFSDSISSGKNIITAGNLDLEMYWTDDLNSGKWHNVEENGYNTIFNYDNWEPGYTDVKYIKLVNAGDLALNYKLALTPQNGVGKLAEVINVYFAEGGVAVEQRSDLQSLQAIGLLKSVLNGGSTADGTLLAADQYSPLHPSGEVIMTLAMNMLTTAGNEYQNEDAGMFSITALATQASFEKDSFGSDYDVNATFPTILTSGSASADVTPADGKVPTGGVTLSGGNISAFVPEGVALNDGVSELTLTVTPLKNTTSDISIVNDEILIPVDVHIEGVAEDNTIPIVIDLGEILPKYLNMGNYRLFHVEDGTNNEMIMVADKADLTTHNQFTYDSNTGAVSVAMASFSEVALLADINNPWQGGYNADWYNTTDKTFTITNADELYAFAKIVGGMADGIAKDTFNGKTVNLIQNINLGGGKASVDGKTKVFYPIGYYNTVNGETSDIYDRDDAVVEGLKGVSSNVSSFSGTFNGNGHTISNFYQNTWEMFGDYNDGYTGTPNYYKDAMGLFGYVNGGTVENLTVDSFTSDGEFTPTGVIAAYAADATFKNIAITHCNPRVYNTGNGGIVGIGGNSDDTSAKKLNFTNITVDKTNTISALWGSWDVACGGIIGMFRGYSEVNFTNCHVAAQIDVYNDVCGNYQYYWYRYAGMMIGSLRARNTEKDGYTVPDLSGIKADGCSISFDEWNDYYYCELVDNSIASYTHDHQFSRLEKVYSVDMVNMTYQLSAESDPIVIPTEGKYNFVTLNGGYETENATCYHFVNGKVWNHEDAGFEDFDLDGNGQLDDYKEDNKHIYLPFNQVFQGDGWGVKHIAIAGEEGSNLKDQGYEDLDIQILDRNYETKFKVLDEISNKKFLFRVGNGNAFPVGKLFAAVDGADINKTGVFVSVTSMVDGVEIIGTFELNEDNWAESTLKITGTGPAKITIQDYSMCTPTELLVEVVDGNNVTAYSELKNANSVLLNDITMTSNGKYSLYDNRTLYGNGFTFNVEAGMDSDTEGGYVGGNGTVWVRNSTLDNVKIIGEVYTQYGGTAKSEYNFPTVLVLGDSVIANSYISNGCAPVRVGSGCNIEIINSTLEGGIFANLDIRGGTVKLKDVTTINQSTTNGQSISNDKGVVGLGIVVYTGSTVTIDADGLTQYNCISKNTTFKAQDANTLKTVIFGNNYKNYQFSYDNATWVNTGIVSMVAEVKGENISDIAGYVGQDASISGYNGYVYAPTGLTSVASPATAYSSSAQYQIAPKCIFDYTSKNNVPQESGSNDYCYYDESTQKYLISFDDGETFTWDADILSITKGEATIDPSISVSNGATVNPDNTITFDTAGDYTVTYKYTDGENYRLNANDKIEKYSADYEKTVRITVYEVQDTSAKTEFAFGNNGFRTETANNLTYVMPDVSATVDSHTAGIGKTTIDGKDIYYPIVSMHKSGSSSWYNYFSVFEAIKITDLNGTVHNTSSTELPSGLTVIGGFILDASGNVSTAESANGTGIFNYSTGKEIKCSTYSSYGLCYYPDSQFSKSTNSRDEQTIVAKYRYTDSNGTPYYYYVGYWCEAHTKQNTCVTGDTLVTLADGTQKRVDALIGTEQLLVWDFYNGEYVSAPVGAIVNHGYSDVSKVTMYFSDGTTIKVLGGHGFYDVSENKFAIIDQFNVKDYVGHEFIKCDDKLNNSKTVLVDYRIETVYDEVWTLVSAYHFDCILEGLLTLSPTDFKDSPAYLMPFEIGEDMKYDPAKMKADIEKYGLYKYEDFADYCTYEQFMGFAFANWKVAVGKGYINFEDIIYLIETYVN